jgi:hypothetical protein
MTIYQTKTCYYVKLAEMDPVERALFTTWLAGLPRPLEKEECAYLFDYRWFKRQQMERKACPSIN